MQQANSDPTVRKRLTLIFPVDGSTVYTVGENCDAINPMPGGGYEVVKGSEVRHVPATRVDHYFQDPRPGYEQEQRDAGKDLPSYAEALADGTFLCRDCNHTAKTVHALKVHHGKRHPAQPD
jgi:hypothetical protein